MKTKTLIPLPFLSEGEKGVVVRFNGGRSFMEKMNSMGITPGEVIEVLTGSPGQALLVMIGNSRLALGFGLANKIEIEKQSKELVNE